MYKGVNAAVAQQQLVNHGGTDESGNADDENTAGHGVILLQQYIGVYDVGFWRHLPCHSIGLGRRG